MTVRKAAEATPFAFLVSHFVRRLFASEQEQGSGSSMGFGIGAVLALVASPGAFASIFLMAKYSTLLEWMRGQHLDPIRRSPSDEYFFVVLSMTITGLVMVSRWNRLFPDKRDFENLAVLPIPIRNIFLANFAALLGLALVFGVVVNGVSALLFPFFVTISIGTAAEFLRVGGAHAATVFSASLFSFFGVFALVGVLTLLLPRVLFRVASIAVRILLVVGLLSEVFSSIVVRLFSGHAAGSTSSYMKWVPPFWFVGMYEHMLGIAGDAMQQLAHQALLGLGIVICAAVAAYAISYRRVFVRLPESFDMVARSRSFFRIRLPEAVLARFFRSPFERACVTFAYRVLLRSEQHLMFVGAYLGVGFVLVAETWLSISPASATGGALPDAETLSIPLLVAFFVASGLRFVFDIPAAREANWVFRSGSNEPEPEPRCIARRVLLWATLPWELVAVPLLTTPHWGWVVALLHTVTVAVLTIFFVDALLLRFRKIPFTCLWQLEIRQLIIRMLATLFAVLTVVPALADLELWLLASPLRFAGLAVVLGIGWYWLHKLNSEDEDGGTPIFDDTLSPPFELLKLT